MSLMFGIQVVTVPVFFVDRHALALEDGYVTVSPSRILGVQLEQEGDDALVDVDDGVLLGSVERRRQHRDAIGTQFR